MLFEDRVIRHALDSQQFCLTYKFVEMFLPFGAILLHKRAHSSYKQCI